MRMLISTNNTTAGLATLLNAEILERLRSIGFFSILIKGIEASRVRLTQRYSEPSSVDGQRARLCDDNSFYGNEEELARLKQFVLAGSPHAIFKMVRMTGHKMADAAALQAIDPAGGVFDLSPPAAAKSPQEIGINNSFFTTVIGFYEHNLMRINFKRPLHHSVGTPTVFVFSRDSTMIYHCELGQLWSR
ncbi:hypothetical protein B0I35DRAFT_414084 [Stachybotrys elegans]|uniref:Uncharacterized protein n=1 Tax=Stachybotrys elegans TaxID=80388 RepID=A0A8K0WK62_9HYPO|nr:hypothetical protein B0I35DRAFT_414084 [Stachybotrys elegans]